MKSPCIAIDVSKGKSHIQGFVDWNKPIAPPFEISHDVEGFQHILKVKHQIETQGYPTPVVVMEATGIYHRCLQLFLEENEIVYYMVNPLQSARFRKQELRSAKTDKRDCKNLAKVFYNSNLVEGKREEDDYHSLRQLSRSYEVALDHLRKTKVNFNEILDIVFPNYNGIFSDVYCELSLEILKKYSHPKVIENKSFHTMSRYLERHTSHKADYIESKLMEVIEAAKISRSGCKEQDIDVIILQRYISEVEFYTTRTAEILEQMIGIAEKIPNYHVIKSIPGIGENLAARIIAEIGDIQRFPGPKQLVAFAGIDPIIYQSGKNDGIHRSISKKGNKRLRSLMYLAVKCSLRVMIKENSIKDYYNKKTQQANSMNSKAASIACANKLLRLIYGMCNTGSMYRYSTQ